MENTYNNFGSKSFLDHRDPLLLGPPLRLDPQSYSALSDYLLTYSYSKCFSGCRANQRQDVTQSPTGSDTSVSFPSSRLIKVAIFFVCGDGRLSSQASQHLSQRHDADSGPRAARLCGGQPRHGGQHVEVISQLARGGLLLANSPCDEGSSCCAQNVAASFGLPRGTACQLTAAHAVALSPLIVCLATHYMCCADR